ncbi:MAG: PIG-L family deacetylase [Acidobacteriota bacterium]
MFSFRRKVPVFLLISLSLRLAAGQENLSGAARARLALARLNTLGSVLMIGAHPDDEHTGTLAYFARGRAMRTGYLSLTRGEGGQNLIGSEQGDLLGVIRTQELLAARRIDGAEQFFTRAIDFGFSKSPEETLAKWGREKILADIVWVIRRFQPDVIILCFSGTPRDGHGHHQASAILGREAFFAAADRTRFPEQLQWVQPWQATRVVWNVYGESDRPGQVTVDTGEYNPVLGYSYAEIAAMSRSMHRSQGMGMAPRLGPVISSFAPVAGEAAAKDLFDGIDPTWGRLPGGAAVAARLAEILKAFDDTEPARSVPALLEIRPLVAKLDARKLAELDETIALCAGLRLDASAARWDPAPGASVEVRATAINRSHADVRLRAPADAPLPYNRLVAKESTDTAPAVRSQPFWLVNPKQGDAYTINDQMLIGEAANPPLWTTRFDLDFGRERIEITRPVRYEYVDRSRGALVRPVAVVPPVAVQVPDAPVVFPDARPKKFEVVLRGNQAAAGTLRLDLPAGWRAEPRRREFHLEGAGEEAALDFELTPPAGQEHATVRAVASIGNQEIASGMRVISYPHFPPQVVFPSSTAELVRADIRILAKRIGYVMGAGDRIPEALGQLGCEVTLLGPRDLAAGDLRRFDAIVTGVRAFNVRPDLKANRNRLLDYVSNGGTLVVQYNVLDYGASAAALAAIGPYPIRISHDRVTVEDAPVAFTDSASPLLHAPNAITAADFAGWIQERGLYFASDWDPRYKTLFESHDPGEPPHAGGTLYTRYGRGVYVFTAYSWFRELPAGVPGAFRVFANLLSAGKVLP